LYNKISHNEKSISLNRKIIVKKTTIKQIFSKSILKLRKLLLDIFILNFVDDDN